MKKINWKKIGKGIGNVLLFLFASGAGSQADIASDAIRAHQRAEGRELWLEGFIHIYTDIYPLKMKVIMRISIDNKHNWFIVELEEKLNFNDVYKNRLVIQIHNEGEYLKEQSNTIVGVFFIKNTAYIGRTKIVKEDLEFNGWGRVN